jgi:hypothetical protein
MAALVFRLGRSRAAISVASEPVPAVVGIAKSGLSGDGGLRPLPTGG